MDESGFFARLKADKGDDEAATDGDRRKVSAASALPVRPCLCGSACAAVEGFMQPTVRMT